MRIMYARVSSPYNIITVTLSYGFLGERFPTYKQISAMRILFLLFSSLSLNAAFTTNLTTLLLES